MSEQMYGIEFWKEQANGDAIRLLDVPYHPQEDDASCGPACLRMVYDFYEVTARSFPESAENGTPGCLMIDCIRQSGLIPELHSHRISDRDLKDVIRLIDDGKPVIMAFCDRSTETGSHYAVLVGYSRQELFFHDPFLRPYFPRSRRTFRKNWLEEGKWYLGVGRDPGLDLRPSGEKARMRGSSLAASLCIVALVIHAATLTPGGRPLAAEGSIGQPVALASSEQIRDHLGRTIGRFERWPNGEVRVYDALGRPLGRADRNGTFDHLGRRISPNNVPGLLLRCPGRAQ